MKTQDGQRGQLVGWDDCPLVERDPQRMHGAWTIKGSRLPLHAIFDNLGAGGSIQDLTDWFEGLTEEQVKAVLSHAARMLEGDRLQGTQES